MAYETVQVQRLTGGCGAEILGVDLKAMSNRQWDEVQAAFAEHGVVFFRDQELTPEQHIAFARRWAPIDVNRFFKPVAGHPEIAEGNHRLTAALLAELPAVSVEVYYKGGSDEHHQIWPFDPDDPRIRVVED